MFEHLKEQPADKILALTEAFLSDPRTEKIDLGVGVYRNAEGLTPVMHAVKEAEQRIWQEQRTKAYTSLVGEAAYRRALSSLILGGLVGEGGELTDRLASTSTVGGTGAVHQALKLARAANPQLKVYYSDPTWPNHITILKALGIDHAPYRYFDPESGEVDIDGMLADLRRAGPGDVVLLHGCCHNPTGANPTPEGWRRIAEVLRETGATVLIDLAYQGFGNGLEEDAAATRMLMSEIDEVMLAASCSKNFGIYRERAGLLAVKTTPEQRDTVEANLAALNRQNFSFPPDHGARIVMTVLEDGELKSDWQNELESVRLNMLKLREQLAAELRDRTGTDRFDFVARHRGMFSRLGLTEDQVSRLRRDAGIYMTADSRINIAGLNSQTVPLLAEAVAKVVAE